MRKEFQSGKSINQAVLIPWGHQKIHCCLQRISASGDKHIQFVIESGDQEVHIQLPWTVKFQAASTLAEDFLEKEKYLTELCLE